VTTISCSSAEAPYSVTDDAVGPLGERPPVADPDGRTPPSRLQPRLLFPALGHGAVDRNVSGGRPGVDDLTAITIDRLTTGDFMGRYCARRAPKGAGGGMPMTSISQVGVVDVDWIARAGRSDVTLSCDFSIRWTEGESAEPVLPGDSSGMIQEM
jgi:hypothetical protein